MPLNEEAKLLSNDHFAKGLLEDDPSRLQFLDVFPFYPVPGNSFTCATNNKFPIGPAVPIDFCDPIPDTTELPIQSTFKMAELATHFEVSYKGDDIFCDVNDFIVLEKDLAIRQLLYRFANMFVLGDSSVNPDEFDGLNKIAGTTITFFPPPVTTKLLDFAKGFNKGNNGRGGIVVTNQNGYEKLRRAYYNEGTVPERVTIEVPCPVTGTRQVSVTAVDGWPVLINDQQPDRAGGVLSDWYFLTLGWENFHGIIPACGAGESMFKYRQNIRPDDSKEVGHVTFPVGIASWSDVPVTRLSENDINGNGPV